MSVDCHIRKLTSQALYMESQDRPSAECYPMYVQTLYYIFHKIHSECGESMSAQTLQSHESLFNLATKLVAKGHEHVQALKRGPRLEEEAPATPAGSQSSPRDAGSSEQVEAAPAASKSLPPVAERSGPDTTAGSGEAAVDDLGLRMRRAATLPANPSSASRRSSNSSMPNDRRASTLSSSSGSSVLAYPPLTQDTYEAFMPLSPLRKAEAENRRLQQRFETTQARLTSGSRRGAAVGLTTRQLQLDRTKFENMELAKRNHEEFLNRLRKQALEVCNDSCTYFRMYREQFHGQPHLQLFYRQATLYNVFHLREQVWYQKLVQGRRPVERCISYIVRDARHPLVSFVRTMAARFFQRLHRLDNEAELEDEEEPDSLEEVARDLNEELLRLAEILTMVIQHSRAADDMLEVNEDEAEDLLPFLSRALYTQTSDGPRFYHQAMKMLRTRLAPKLVALQTAMAWPGDRQRTITEVDPALLTQSHEEDVAAFADGRAFVRALQQTVCPFEKLQVMNRAALALVEATTKISGRDNARDLGADELTPLFSYVVLCWQEPELLLQCSFLEMFAAGKALLGMEGYSLVSLQASVSFCVDAVSKD